MMAETTSLKSNGSTEANPALTTQAIPVHTDTSPSSNHQTSPALPPKTPHQQSLATLQEAFPSVEPGVIEAILESQSGNMEASFELLLTMSDPDYQAPVSTDGTTTTDDNRFALEQQEKEDALLARQLARQYGEQQRGQPQPQRQENESVFSGFQEELPVIKERVIEAGNAAKKKIMGFYNSFMEQNSNNNNNSNSNNTRGYQQQQELTNDMRGLRISSDSIPVTPQAQRLASASPAPLTRTSTSDQQLDDDAAFARRLAMEDAHLERLSAQRLKQQQQQQQGQDQYEKKGMNVEEGDAVTFTTPDDKPAYIINDEEEEELDFYGVDDDLLSDVHKDQQQAKTSNDASSKNDHKTDHKQD